MAADDGILGVYRQLADMAARMLALAREGQWSPLPELDARFGAMVDRLRESASARDLSPEERSEAAALLAGTQAAQQHLAALLQPRLAELARELEDLHRRKGLIALYRCAT